MSVHPKAQGIAQKVNYERSMVRATVDLLTRDDLSLRGRTDWQEIKNSLLESLLLHTRVMRDFLYRDTSKYWDDVLAVHFFDDPAQWTSERPPVGAYLTANKERLDKAMAHLSYERSTYEASGKDWDMGAMVTELEAAWSAFWSALPPERQAWFDEMVP